MAEFSHFHPAILLYRLGWVTVLIVSMVFLSQVNITGTNPGSQASGGLSNCFFCRNGWNWHVVYYTLAFPVFMAEALISFKLPIVSRAGYFYNKMWHLTLQCAVMAMSIVGLYAVVREKQVTPSNGSMYSGHSWTGVMVLSLFLAQFVFGILAFVLLRSRIPGDLLQELAKWHNFVGRVTFFLALECCVNGWMDMQMMMIMSGQPYMTYSNQMKYFGAFSGPPTATFMESGIMLVYYFLFFIAFYVTWPPASTPSAKERAQANAAAENFSDEVVKDSA